MMKEKLSAHKVEWEIMRGPRQEKEPSRVIETGTGAFNEISLFDKERGLIVTHDDPKHQYHDVRKLDRRR